MIEPMNRSFARIDTVRAAACGYYYAREVGTG